MELINTITVNRSSGDAAIELLQGDLSQLPEQHRVDMLVVSAFPDSYTPNEGTLFAALYHRGFDMQKWAEKKEIDDRDKFDCWLSKPLPHKFARKFNFQRILCFEPGCSDNTLEPYEVVGNVFRCINNFVLPEVFNEDNQKRKLFDIKTVAMPVLATGNQQVPVEQMMPALLEAAVFWLQKGLPIAKLKIVVYNSKVLDIAKATFVTFNNKHSIETKVKAIEAKDMELFSGLAEKIMHLLNNEGLSYFTRLMMSVATDAEKTVVNKLVEKLWSIDKAQLATEIAALPGESRPYDFFISYPHTHSNAVRQFLEALQKKYPSANIFHDSKSIPIGAHWIRTISDAIECSKQFIAILSPDYSKSPVCWDEFQCAKLMETRTKKSIIRTIRLYKEEKVSPILAIYSYEDCMEGNVQLLVNAVAKLSYKETIA